MVSNFFNCIWILLIRNFWVSWASTPGHAALRYRHNVMYFFISVLLDLKKLLYFAINFTLKYEIGPWFMRHLLKFKLYCTMSPKPKSVKQGNFWKEGMRNIPFTNVQIQIFTSITSNFISFVYSTEIDKNWNFYIDVHLQFDWNLMFCICCQTTFISLLHLQLH